MSSWEALGQCDDWRTPKYIFEALGCVFDMDAAAAPLGVLSHVPAKAFLSRDSLETEWRGYVWLNAPYGPRNGLEPWVKKFFDHGDGLVIVPDRCNAPWWMLAAKRCDAALFLARKVRFIRPNGELGKSPGCGSCIFGVGERGVAALVNARSLGWLAKPG